MEYRRERWNGELPSSYTPRNTAPRQVKVESNAYDEQKADTVAQSKASYINDYINNLDTEEAERKAKARAWRLKEAELEKKRKQFLSEHDKTTEARNASILAKHAAEQKKRKIKLTVLYVLILLVCIIIISLTAAHVIDLPIGPQIGIYIGLGVFLLVDLYMLKEQYYPSRLGKRGLHRRNY